MQTRNSRVCYALKIASFDEEQTIADIDVKLVCFLQMKHEIIIFYRSGPTSQMFQTTEENGGTVVSCLKIYGVLPDGDSCFMNDRKLRCSSVRHHCRSIKKIRVLTQTTLSCKENCLAVQDNLIRNKRQCGSALGRLLSAIAVIFFYILHL